MKCFGFLENDGMLCDITTKKSEKQEPCAPATSFLVPPTIFSQYITQLVSRSIFLTDVLTLCQHSEKTHIKGCDGGSDAVLLFYDCWCFQFT